MERLTLKEIEEILPESGNFQLSGHEKIIDYAKFKERHIAFLKANPRNKTYMPYYRRLKHIACQEKQK